MFSNLVGFIKPLFKKDLKSMKSISKIRAPGEDESPQQQEFEELVHRYPDDADGRKKNVVSESHDELELSLDALRMIVEQSHESAEIKKHAWDIISRLEKQGFVTIPFDPDKPVIGQLQIHLKDDTRA